MFDIGDKVKTTAVFKDAVSAPTDPATTTLKVREPSGVETAYLYGTDPEVVTTGTGSFSAEFVMDAAGEWVFRWIGTGAVAAAQEIAIQVRPSKFTTP